jgi:RND family efflux transporter MFP subunit
MKTILPCCRLLLLGLILLAGVPSRAAVISAPGITEPILDVTIGTPVAGIIGERLVQHGDFVKKGQPIFALDKNLEELEAARKQLIMELAQTELDRAKKLLEKSAISISREEMDKKVAEFKVATVEHELAKEFLQKRTILAPLEGYVTELYLEAGEACQAQQPVARIVDTRRCYFISNVESRAGHALKAGQQVDLEIESGPSTVRVRGTINFVSPVVDPASGLLRIRAVFDNPNGIIRPGVAGNLFFEGASHVN